MVLRLYKMSLQGAVAVCNLTLLGIALLVWIGTFPELVVNLARATETQLVVDRVLWTAVAVLTTPLGWLIPEICVGPADALLAAMIVVPVNAYLWGWAIAALCRRVKGRRPASQARDAGGATSGEQTLGRGRQ